MRAVADGRGRIAGRRAPVNLIPTLRLRRQWRRPARQKRGHSVLALERAPRRAGRLDAGDTGLRRCGQAPPRRTRPSCRSHGFWSPANGNAVAPARLADGGLCGPASSMVSQRQRHEAGAGRRGPGRHRAAGSRAGTASARARTVQAWCADTAATTSPVRSCGAASPMSPMLSMPTMRFLSLMTGSRRTCLCSMTRRASSRSSWSLQ